MFYGTALRIALQRKGGSSQADSVSYDLFNHHHSYYCCHHFYYFYYYHYHDDDDDDEDDDDVVVLKNDGEPPDFCVTNL